MPEIIRDAISARLVVQPLMRQPERRNDAPRAIRDIGTDQNERRQVLRFGEIEASEHVASREIERCAGAGLLSRCA
jgi:hypothetical protein